MPDSNRQKLILTEGLKSIIVDKILILAISIRQNVSETIIFLRNLSRAKLYYSPTKCSEMTIKNWNQAN